MPQNRSTLRNRLELQLYRCARAVTQRLAVGSLDRLGAVLGELFLLANRRRRRILLFNLQLVYPELPAAERRRLAGAVARHHGRVALDSVRVLDLSPETLLAQVAVSGREHLQAGLAHGRGLLLLSAHLGSWEVAALVAGLLLPGGLALVTRPLDNPLLEAELSRLRGRFGNQPLGKTGVMRRILQRLAAGNAVGLLSDQRSLQSDGIQVPFFGLGSWSHPAPARLVLHTGAPVVPIWGLRRGPGRYTVRFDPPLLAGELPEPEQTETALIGRFNELTETIIRAHPEQWLWFHDRWRHLRLGVRPETPFVARPARKLPMCGRTRSR